MVPTVPTGGREGFGVPGELNRQVAVTGAVTRLCPSALTYQFVAIYWVSQARNRIQTPAKLEQLIKDFIDKHEWLSYDADLKGDAYEGLIEKTAQEGARGAGQYFTPRALISAIVDVMLPRPDHRICDPACGTGGFFLGAYRSIIERFTPLEPDQVAHLRSGAFTGWEIADLPARLCAMNLLLHGIESPESDSPIYVDDALRADPGQRFDMVLTNPPFGPVVVGQLRAGGLLGHHPQQATQLRAARGRPARSRRHRSRRGARQRPLRGRSGARRSAGACCTTARSTPCYACRRASSTPRA